MEKKDEAGIKDNKIGPFPTVKLPENGDEKEPGDIKVTESAKAQDDMHPKPGEKPKKTTTDDTGTGKPGNLRKKDKPDESITIQDIFRQHRYIFKWLGLLVPFIVFLLIEGYKYNRRRLILVRQRSKKPPLVWPIKVDTPGTSFIKNDWFYRAARFLHKRMESDFTDLDLEKTISATIGNADYPTLHYKPLTRPPEYMVLIDLPGYRDHYARLWDSLVTALAGEGVYVTRYFYERDPRVCFKEPDGQREYLSVLKTRYSDHRLIIFGDGEGMLDPLTGEPDKWTSLFKVWRERALLTPRRPREWSRQEIALAGEFVLVPATLEGLCALENHWELPTEPGLKTWKQADEKFPFLPPGRKEQVEELRKYLGKDTFQWLCVCAVYPELHWDLTLYLGTLPCMPDNLVSEENMLRLLRLPWFRTGSMPDELRWELISKLDTGKSRAIRAAIVELLEKNPAPTDSFAYDTYRLHLAVQRWMLSRADRKKHKAALTSLKNIGEKRIVQDYTMLRFLEAAPVTPLNFVLPQRLRKLFYRKGVLFFGIKTGIRVALTVLIAIALFLLLKDTSRYVPPGVQAVTKKAERVYQNEKSFWEADYDDGIIMVYIPAGEFTMGSTDYDDEKPLHQVYLDGYWIGKYEVTFSQYDKYCEENGKKKPSDRGWSRGNHPVINVSWDDAAAYCQWLSGKTSLNFKLPTEAQWEKAARGADSRKYPWGNSKLTGNKANFADKQLWLKSKYNWADKEMDDGYAYIAPVGSYPGGISSYGLYDMVGNVWEWCSDWYDADYYRKSPARNPQGPDNGSYHVMRGGGWNNDARYLRCAYRSSDFPGDRYFSLGFRLCQENKFIYTFDKVINERKKSQLKILEINPGFEFIEDTASTKSEPFSVKMVRIDQSLYEFRVLGRDPKSNNALSLDNHQRLTNAICVLNGSFRKTFNAHETIGLLIIDGKMVNPLTRKLSGIFAVNNTGAFIIYTKDFTTSKDYKYALQTYPVIISEDKRVSESLNKDKISNRAFVAVDRENRIILGTSTPVSLYQLAIYLRQKKGLNCTLALNLEGGVSGMVIKFKNFYKKIDVTDYPVPNAIAVFSK